MIISHEHPKYITTRNKMQSGMYNGAYYYSRDITRNLIPNVETNRPWVTINIPGECVDNAIVFIHANKHLERYNWLRRYRNLVLVVSSVPARRFAQQLGKVIFLPLSVDVSEVEKYKTKKTKDACYAGNRWAFKERDIRRYVSADTDFLGEMPREELLKEIAPYKTCYAIGRTAIEAKVLGCDIKVCDSRYPNPDFWEVIDNKEAARKLQAELDIIDNVERS